MTLPLEFSVFEHQQTVSSKDRLSATLILALIIHAIIILGIGFKVLIHKPLTKPPKLNVTLVQIQSKPPPKIAQVLAQANQIASGDASHSGHPGAPFSAPSPFHQSGVAPFTLRLETAHSPASNIPTVMTTSQAHHVIEQTHHMNQSNHSARSQHWNIILEQARLAAEIRLSMQDYNHARHRLYLDTLNAKSNLEAAYLARWVRHVQRIGNLNYPRQAIQAHLHGELVLNVLINAHGQLIKAWIARSSGIPLLDRSALRIVHEAEPFPPLPPSLSKRYSQILITRTWLFSAQGFHARPLH